MLGHICADGCRDLLIYSEANNCSDGTLVNADGRARRPQPGASFGSGCFVRAPPKRVEVRATQLF